MGRLPRVLIFPLSLLPPSSNDNCAGIFTKDEDVCGYVNGCVRDAYKIRPNCWFFFPHLIYRVLYSSASRSKRLSRFVVIIYMRLFMEKIKKSKFFSFLLFQNLPFPLQIRLKFYHTFHILYIYTYRKHYYIHHVSSPRLRESRKLDNYLSTYPIVFTAPFRRGIPRTIVGRTLRSTWTIDKDRAIRRLVKVEDDGIIGNVTRSRERKSYKYVILPAADG